LTLTLCPLANPHLIRPQVRKKRIHPSLSPPLPPRRNNAAVHCRHQPRYTRNHKQIKSATATSLSPGAPNRRAKPQQSTTARASRRLATSRRTRTREATVRAPAAVPPSPDLPRRARRIDLRFLAGDARCSTTVSYSTTTLHLPSRSGPPDAPTQCGSRISPAAYRRRAP
jgi:hypothetical protein